MWELLLWEPRPRGDGAFAQTQRSISRPIAPRAALPQGSNEAPKGPPQGSNEAQSRPLCRLKNRLMPAIRAWG